MRANRALQVLGFLLSLARGSEVGNSQAGKRCVNTGRLRTWDSELGQPQAIAWREAGGAEIPGALGSSRQGRQARILSVVSTVDCHLHRHLLPSASPTL